MSVSVEQLRAAPFRVFGLAASWPGPRTLATWSLTEDGVPSLVGLGHGVKDHSAHPYVEVISAGALHGQINPSRGMPAGGTWTEDPDSVGLFYIATRAWPDLPGDEFPASDQ